MIRLVTFDVTGTLLRPIRTVGEQYASAVYTYLQRYCDGDHMTKSFRKSYKTYNDGFPIFGRYCGITPRQWWASVFLNTIIHSGTAPQFVSKKFNKMDVPLWEIVEADDNLRKAFEEIYHGFEWEVVCHSTTLMEFLKTRCVGISLGIITNNDGRVLSSLKQAGLLDYMDFVVTSHECGYEKPDQKIFHNAIECASSIKKTLLYPHETLHIGDNFEKDYIGAVSAGCKALLVDPDGAHKENRKLDPNHCIKDLLVGLKVLQAMTSQKNSSTNEVV